MSRQYLRLTTESTWGTYNSGGNTVIVQIDQNNAFTMRAKPVRWTVRSAGSFNRRVQTGSSKTGVAGNLNMLLYGSQAAYLMPWIVANSSNVLGSMTADHVVIMDDAGNTAVERRYTGVMVQQAQITANEQDQLMRLQLDLIAQQPGAVTLADPAVTTYPSDPPYTFEMASGSFTLATSRTEFENFQLTIKNYLDARFFESQYLTMCKYCGRDVHWQSKLKYKITTDRTDLEAVTAVTANITFTVPSPSTHSIEWNFNTQNFFDSVEDDLALDKVHLQNLSLQSYFDTTASTPNDLAVSVA